MKVVALSVSFPTSICASPLDFRSSSYVLAMRGCPADFCRNGWLRATWDVLRAT
ncbi:hypothetical protein A2U01_0021789, partial [Trifolium medium]|nr:hypothetical protein [Trifolium medium]